MTNAATRTFESSDLFTKIINLSHKMTFTDQLVSIIKKHVVESFIKKHVVKVDDLMNIMYQEWADEWYITEAARENEELAALDYYEDSDSEEFYTDYSGENF